MFAHQNEQEAFYMIHDGKTILLSLPTVKLPQLRAGLSLRYFVLIAVSEALALAWLLTAALDDTARAAVVVGLAALVMAGVVQRQRARE
jgi:hypothetical protein